MKILIGIDDTDNHESRGTGFISRKMGKELEDNGLGNVIGITRHQLFFDPRIPYTSQNSSACLLIENGDTEKLHKFCSSFLLENAAEGSDVGLCIAKEEQINENIINWGIRAKKEVLTQNEAIELAHNSGIILQGLTGTKDGIIGSLAAIGLRNAGEDGRFIMLKGKKELRSVEAGRYSANELLKDLNLDLIQGINGKTFPENENIFFCEWARPVLKNNKIILLVEEILNNGNYEWRTASKEYIKSVSD